MSVRSTFPAYRALVPLAVFRGVDARSMLLRPLGEGRKGGSAMPNELGIAIGDLVYTMDRWEVGKVSSVTETGFRISTADGEKWTAHGSVYIRTHRRVELICNRSGLSSYLHDA